MKASYLGAAGLTILARCPCGCRNYFDRGRWRRLGLLACDNCGLLIGYDLGVVNSLWAGGRRMGNGVEQEVADMRTVEDSLREFVKYFDEQVEAARRRGSGHHPFAPRTVQLVEEVRPLLARLDQARAGRAA